MSSNTTKTFELSCSATDIQKMIMEKYPENKKRFSHDSVETLNRIVRDRIPVSNNIKLLDILYRSDIKYYKYGRKLEIFDDHYIIIYHKCKYSSSDSGTFFCKFTFKPNPSQKSIIITLETKSYETYIFKLNVCNLDDEIDEIDENEILPPKTVKKKPLL